MANVECTIVVQAPADTVYQIWRNFGNMPQIMSNIEDVRETGDGKSHWKARAPLGAHAEWDAEITRDEPGRAIAWRSIDSDDSNVRTHGSVAFDGMGDSTRIIVALDYETTTGGVTETVAKIFANPEKQIEEDLGRFKERVEQGGHYARATDEVVANPDTPGAQRTVGKYPDTKSEGPPPFGPGTPEPGTMRAPTTTGTPGGALGAPTGSELKRDPEERSERMDPRTGAGAID